MHAPGWYPDPTVPAQVRWWDGQAFTEHVHPVPPGARLATQAAGSAPVRPAGFLRRQKDFDADLAAGKNAHAGVALVCGGISMLGVIPAWIAGLVFGVLGLRRAHRYVALGHAPIGRGMALGAIGLSVVGVAATALGIALRLQAA